MAMKIESLALVSTPQNLLLLGFSNCLQSFLIRDFSAFIIWWFDLILWLLKSYIIENVQSNSESVSYMRLYEETNYYSCGVFVVVCSSLGMVLNLFIYKTKP